MKTSDKIFAVLRLFSTDRPEWTVEAAAGEMDLPQSTTYEYFRTLTRSGLIAPTANGLYVLGPAVIELNRIVTRSDPMLVEGGSVLETMVQDAPVPVVGLLCRLYRMKVMCVEQRVSQGAVFGVSYERGRLMPLFRGAASKVILAHVERRRVKRLFEENAQEIAANGLGESWAEFRLMLRRSRSQKIFITRGEIDPGRIGLSVPLLNATGESFGSISFVLEEKDFDGSASVQEELRRRLIDAADLLSARMAGHR